jgi:hypothetical protein
MRTNDTAYLQPAFDIIRTTDPNLYRRMKNSDWTIHVVDEPSDLLPLLREGLGMPDVYGLAESLDDANGVTILPQAPVSVAGDTWLNRPYLNAQADEMHLDRVRVLAYTIAHEFNHHEGGREPTAYTAGTEFAQKMGDRGVAQLSELTRQSVMQSGQYYS